MNQWVRQAIISCVLSSLVLSGCSPSIGEDTATNSAPGKQQATVVSLTFDDGDADNFEIARTLSEQGLRATWYISSGLVGKPDYMTWDQLKVLSSQGHEIGGHTLEHINIGELDSEELRREVCDDRQNLLAHGFDPVSFAYPFGGYNVSAKQIVQECGYSSARTIGAGPESVPPSDAFTLRAFPYAVADTEFGKLQRYVTGTRSEEGGWVILIFHHVCNSCDYFSVKPEVLNRFIQWLGEQRELHRLKVKTVREVMLEAVSQ